MWITVQYLTAVIERRCALANCRSAEAVLIERGKMCVCRDEREKD